MGCSSPILAVDYGINKETGKHDVKFLPRSRIDIPIERYRLRYGDMLMTLPCGQCIGCKKDYSRLWQARCCMEAESHKDNVFLTLTYREPAVDCWKDLTLFLYKIKNRFPGFKYFACCERGSLTKRLHLHIILFGVDFADKELVTRRGSYFVYGSKEAEQLWSHGFVELGEVNDKVAGYVSQYVFKKNFGQLEEGEFLRKSKGLGLDYYMNHKNEFFDSDYIVIGSNKFKIPRYFVLKAFMSEDPNLILAAWSYTNKKKIIASTLRFNSLRSMCEDRSLTVENDILLAKLKHDKQGRNCDL